MARTEEQAPRRRTVVVGLLGPRLDYAAPKARWDRWRPTVSVCQHEDLLVDRFELLFQKRYGTLAEQVTGDLALVSPETEVVPHHVEFADPWDFEDVFGALHAFARGYEFDVEREDYLVHITTGTHVAQISLFLLTESRHLPGRLLQTGPPAARARDRGADVGTYQIIDLDLSRYDLLASRFEGEHAEGVSLLKSGIETKNAAFNRSIEALERVALVSRDPILLTGPTGAGKSQLALRIAELKRARQRLAGPFVEVNCATLRGDSASSALFGHRKGAFTGATADRAGLLRTADRGLLFLDEVGELGLDEQAMLLRALEHGRFRPLGADAEEESEFQLIAGTNRDLGAMVRDGRFREDLLARIDLWTFRLPGLAERLEDLEPNLDYELDEFTRRTGTRVGFNREARERYVAFATGPDARWAANFRDLNASVTRMATLARGGRITAADVVEELARLRAAWSQGSAAPAARGEGEAVLREVLGADGFAELDPFDRVQLAEVARVCRRAATLSEAGRELFRVSRTRRKVANDADRLRKYLGRNGLEFADFRGVAQPTTPTE